MSEPWMEIAVDLVTYLENVELMCALSDDAMRRIRDEVKRAYDAGCAAQAQKVQLNTFVCDCGRKLLVEGQVIGKEYEAVSPEPQAGKEPLRYRCGCIVEHGKFHDDEDHMEGFSCESNAPVVAKGDGAVLGESRRSAKSAIPPITRCPKCPDTKVTGLYCSTCGYRLDGKESVAAMRQAQGQQENK